MADATIPTMFGFRQRRAQVITVINLKGGVGKTHTAWLLAGVCQERKRRVLVVDTDTQGNIRRQRCQEPFVLTVPLRSA